MPRMSAIPLEMSDNPAATYAATRHGSLQNADAVLDHITGVLSGLDLKPGRLLEAGRSTRGRTSRWRICMWSAKRFRCARVRAAKWRSPQHSAVAPRARRSHVLAMTPVGDDWYRARYHSARTRHLLETRGERRGGRTGRGFSSRSSKPKEAYDDQRARAQTPNKTSRGA